MTQGCETAFETSRLSIYPAPGNHRASHAVYPYAIKHSVAAVIPVSPYLSMRAFFWGGTKKVECYWLASRPDWGTRSAT
ncbi:hypothetical protein FHX59_002690 [Paraburkholderia silvatlantica]|uniref:Uncharacterized protein n=1 Tax=Paraburkholderia silvatlantica TaxID=321895 RepID=A0A2U1AE81_9BURK|nr:hypothetical protein [Paraburkholderia silvatlantica]PVY34685.1 hypothetical protein C7411_107226 [Paraburkholderia silvatlantica]PXW38900.1 hypothetical protein C7413_107226 [Paraburkholderia silvatlantica]PYE22434.1 hypothetical protein C7410_11055 [Paraburkholderia silvatlantica]TDQ89712.1 hypothetical protein C7412_114165 [Paraburkholderia silvatlantica]